MNQSTAQALTQSLHWHWQAFSELDTERLYQIMRARVDVFVVEQHCPYPELDGKDSQAHHLSAWNDAGELFAYLRVLPPGLRFTSPAIGRVLTTAQARGSGLGRELMMRGIKHCLDLYPGQDIELGAQHHLAPFYASLGFVAYGEVYLEDGIPHIDMCRAA